jgi:hypothetical protein
MATCNLCGQQMFTDCATMAEEIVKMDDHLRVMHPDVYGDGPERWPDGAIVIEDTTLEPGDFTDGEP